MRNNDPPPPVLLGTPSASPEKADEAPAHGGGGVASGRTGKGRLNVEIVGDCAHMAWRGFVTVDAVGEARHRLGVLAETSLWHCAVVDFTGCTVCSDTAQLLREFQQPAACDGIPVAWLVLPGRIEGFNRLARAVSAAGLCRQAFTNGDEAMAWALARGRVWQAEVARRLQMPASGRAGPSVH
jgi:hypothetical protein